MDPESSREDEPISKCSVKLALGEVEPGFVVPKAQMMFWVPRVPLTGIVKANFGVEPVTSLPESSFVATEEGLESMVGKL